MDFDKKTLWDQKHKAFKLYAKKDPKGKHYLIGQLTHTVTVQIQKNDFAEKGDEYIAYFIPVKYTKKGTDNSHPPQQNNKQNNKQNNEPEELPF